MRGRRFSFGRLFMQPLRQHRSFAFTMVEMIMSLTIVALLMLALGSVVRLALSTTGGIGLTNSTSGAQSADLASQVAADLNVALNFTEKTTSAVTFTVPDRDGSGTTPSIRYAWSGAPPATQPYVLTRAYNGGSPVTLSSNVRKFGLNYLYRSMSPPATAVESQLISDPVGVGGTQNDSVTNSTWRAAAFKPTFTGSPSSWTLTRVSLVLLSDSSVSGMFKVRIRAVDSSHHPTGASLAEVVLPEGILADSAQWIDVPFALSVNTTTYPSLAVELDGLNNTGNQCYWQGINLVVAPVAPYSTSTTNGDGSWSTASTTYGYRFKVFGTVP